MSAAVAAALAAGWIASASATLAPVQHDTYVAQNTPNRNYGSDVVLLTSYFARTLIKFDLSTLPTGTIGADVGKATIILWICEGSLTRQPS